MTFSTEDRLKALAIVNVFETSRPFGDYAACVVLNDGAGVSYGINQFTHRSGSLAAVVKKYLSDGGQTGKETLVATLATLNKNSKTAIAKLASDEAFKKALRAAAVTVGMKNAQNATAFDLYLRPALEICERRGFTLPLSLAVVYDSITHGSWDSIAAKVRRNAGTHARMNAEHEKLWITEYVRTRHAWLTRTSRLKATTYRTRFFLDQIAAGNWQLRIPLNVHGVRLTAEMFSSQIAETNERLEESPRTDALNAAEEALGILPSPSRAFDAAAAGFDRLDGVVSGVMARSDRAKSLWTTIGGTLWQAAWAVFGFFAGLPREVWIVVAVIAGLFTLLFLYRQIVLGKVREQATATASEN